jgi:hypothetical protein
MYTRPTFRIALAGLLLVLAVAGVGCTRQAPELTPVADVGPCGMPLDETNSMTRAIERADEVLQACPREQEQVLAYLIEVGRKNPRVQNREEILDLYERMIRFEVVNAREANDLLTRYFYVRFASVDRIQERFSSLSDRALIRLSGAIEDELALKKIGLKEVSGRADQYERAKDYAHRMQDLLESTRIQWDYLRDETETAQR